MRPHIYLDMDGVMTDFVGAVLRTWQREVSVPVRTDWSTTAPRGIDRLISHWVSRRRMDESDIDAWAIEDRLGVSCEDFWHTIDHWSWWHALEAYPWATPLFEMLSFYGNVTYLTSPARSAGAAAGKLTWIRDRHGKNFSNWIFTNHKEHVAGPGKILVDDSENNCDAWERAGGYAILVPQYWNRGRALRATFGRSDRSTDHQIREFVATIEAAVKGALS